MNDKWHGSHHYSNKIHLFLVAFLLLAIANLIFGYLGLNRLEVLSKIKRDRTPPISAQPSPSLTGTLTPTATPSEDDVFCTQEAKLCPDGSYVGREGPNCEFAPCPTPSTR